jgi:hypothetical protein
MEDLKRANEPPPPELEEVMNQPAASAPNKRDKRQQPQRKSGASSPISEEGIKKTRRREMEIAAAEKRQMDQDRAQQELQYTPKRKEFQRKQRDEMRWPTSSTRKPTHKRGAETVPKDFAQIAAKQALEQAPEQTAPAPPIVVEPLKPRRQRVIFEYTPETVQKEIKIIKAAHARRVTARLKASTAASESPPKPELKSTVDELVAAHILVVKDRAGDYSRYLPPNLGVDRTLGEIGPAAYAQLILARRREARLDKRLEAVQVVERLVGMGEAKAEAQ